MRRRDFIQQSLAAFCGISSTSIASAYSPRNSRGPFNIAVVGCGKVGLRDIHSITRNPNFNLAGICDVDKNRTIKVGEHNLIPSWQDYRLMFKEIGDEIDGVVVATPDHMHFPVILRALENDSHIFCHSPLCHTLSELNSIKDAIRPNICLDVGLKNIYSPVHDLVCEIIQSDQLGSIQSIHAWTGNPSWMQATPKSERVDSIPKELDWNLWLGVAPHREYADRIYTPHMWRGVKDFGSGLLGDRFFEIMAIVFRSISSVDPKKIQCISNVGPTEDKYGNDRHIKISCSIGPACKGKRIDINWMEGNVRPDMKELSIVLENELPRSGCIFVGTDGFLCFSKNKIIETTVPNPRKLLREKSKRTIPYYNDIDCHEIWRRACIAESSSYCSIDAMYSCLETSLVASISAKNPLKVLEWDRKTNTFNDQRADSYIKKEYRKF